MSFGGSRDEEGPMRNRNGLPPLHFRSSRGSFSYDPPDLGRAAKGREQFFYRGDCVFHASIYTYHGNIVNMIYVDATCEHSL